MLITAMGVPVPALGGTATGVLTSSHWEANISEVGGVPPYSLLERLGALPLLKGQSHLVESHTPTLCRGPELCRQ